MHKDKNQLNSQDHKPMEVVALVGSPNSGKTTLFNWLTGLRYNTVNYPGSTVDYSVGTTHERYGAPIHLMDTPGIYSLFPKSPDEEVTVKALFSHPQYGRIATVVLVADSTQLARHLIIGQQLVEAGVKVIYALTMLDLLKEKGYSLNLPFLESQLGGVVVSIDGRLGGGVAELINQIRKSVIKGEQITQKIPHKLDSWSREKTEKTLTQLQSLVKEATKITNQKKGLDATERTARWDRWLLHPFWGLLFFVGIMSSLFTSIYVLAQPLMDGVDAIFSRGTEFLMSLDPQALWVDFLAHGVVTSVGAVMVFVPQIFILFLIIAVLEDSGYLARSATLVDRPLRWLGMGGKSFVPLLSGFACAVPAMMATRTISNKRERWLTLMIIPLMSCSARLPVYALLLAFLFTGSSAWKAGLSLTGIYLLSLVVGAIASLIVSQLIPQKENSLFCLELPVYRRPQLGSVIKQAINRTRSYLRRAGPTIFILSVIIWVGTTFPHYNSQNPQEKLDHSYMGQVGRYVEPVFKPMGVDWRVGIGLMSAFAAREVFVSSLAVVLGADDQVPDSLQKGLLQKMNSAKRSDGRPLFTVASVVGLIVFFMIALQCLSTTSVARREMGGWKLALIQLVVLNVVAYGAAVGCVEVLETLSSVFHFN